MSETWAVRIEPPPDSYEAVVRRLSSAVAASGWVVGTEPKDVLVPTDNPHRGSSTASPSDLLLGRGGAGIVFRRGEDGLVLENSEEPGWIELGGDFQDLQALSANQELVGLLRATAVPGDTTILGDTELRWEVFKNLHVEADFDARRAEEFGFFWIDTLTTRHLDALLQARPAVFRGILVETGTHHVVRLWDNPYDRVGETEEWRSLARTIGRIRP